MRPLFVLLLLPFLVTGCGYRSGVAGPLAGYSSISVPYIQGDLNGDFTSALVEELGRSGCFRYQRDCGQATLYVRIVDVRKENIGFRYDVNKDGTPNKSVIPDETRLAILTEFEVVETGSCCRILGPVQFWTGVDFDHDYYSSQDGVNVLSLGQFSDYDAALEAAERPLHRKAAQKIVDYLKFSW